MIDAGRCVSCAACEIDSSPTNETIASDVPSISWYGAGPVELHRVDQQLRPKREEKAEAEDQRFADDVERGDDAVERRALAHADDVEQAEPENEAEHDHEVEPRMQRVARTGTSWLV